MQDVKLKSSDIEAADVFGSAVHLSGSWAVVGAQAEDQGGSQAGAIYVFERDNCGLWFQRGKLVANDASSGSYLGTSTQLGFRNASVGGVLKTYLTVIGGATGAGPGSTGAAYWFEKEIPSYTSICPPKE